MTQKLRAMMCNYVVTVPLWETQMQVAVKNKPAVHVAVSEHMQDFAFLLDEDAHRSLIVVVRTGYKILISCGECCKLKEKYQVYRNSYGSCSLLKLPQSSFCVHLRPAKRSKSCMRLLAATCTAGFAFPTKGWSPRNYTSWRIVLCHLCGLLGANIPSHLSVQSMYSPKLILLFLIQ